ncbi:hypothetical protein PF007_g18050, partial [Phytophthora fragariae]
LGAIPRLTSHSVSFSPSIFSDVAALADLAQRLRVFHQPLTSHLPSRIEQVDHFRTRTDSITVANQRCASLSRFDATSW